MAVAKTGKKARDEREKMIVLKMKFENRITIAKFGKTALDSGDYGGALKKFLEYLNVIAESKKCKDIYSLRPTHFDPRRDITEMLMISHLFFEMARIYDAIPQFQGEAKLCLEQFVAFSANQPYQVINSEMARRKLKKLQFRDPESFRHAYLQIFVQSKKCYIVTFCYGDGHLITQQCRQFKDWLWQYKFGQELVRFYYLHSSQFIDRYGDSRPVHWFSRIFVRPTLLLFAKTILPFIIK